MKYDMTKDGGRRLAERAHALGSLLVETTPSGLRALAASGQVRAIVEDQPISLVHRTRRRGRSATRRRRPGWTNAPGSETLSGLNRSGVSPEGRAAPAVGLDPLSNRRGA